MAENDADDRNGLGGRSERNAESRERRGRGPIQTRDPRLAVENDAAAREALARFAAAGVHPAELARLQRRIPIVFPWDADYNTLRLNNNKVQVVFPMGIVMARMERDVVRTFRWLRAHPSIPFAMRSGGHCLQGYSLSPGIVIDQSRRTGVSVLPERPPHGKEAMAGQGDEKGHGHRHSHRQGHGHGSDEGANAGARGERSSQAVVVESGATNGRIAAALEPHDLYIASGLCDTVAVAGLTLGGGLGFTMRLNGLTCDSLLAVRMLLADGRVVTATRRNRYRDLFWASRGGGGGNFGIALSFTMRAAPRPPVAVVFELSWPAASLQRVVSAFQRWAPFAPREVTAEVLLRPFRGPEPPVVVKGLWLIDADRLRDGVSAECDARRAVRKGLGRMFRLDPQRAALHVGSYGDAAERLALSVEPPSFVARRSSFAFDRLPRRAIRTLSRHMRDAPEGCDLEIDAMRGAVADIGPTDTAFPHREALMWLQFNAGWSVQREGEAKVVWLAGFADDMSRWLRGAYVNVPEPTLADPLRQYYGPNLPRLKRVKRRYDPEGGVSLPAERRIVLGKHRGPWITTCARIQKDEACQKGGGKQKG